MSTAVARLLPALDERSEVGPIAQIPVHALAEARQTLEQLGAQYLHREERGQPDHRAELERQRLALAPICAVEVEGVVEEPVLLVP